MILNSSGTRPELGWFGVLFLLEVKMFLFSVSCMDTKATFPSGKAYGAWRSALTPNYCQNYQWINLCLSYVMFSWHRDSFTLVASSPLCDSILVENKCINICHDTTVFSNCWRNQLHVLALLWVGHHQVETRISEKTHILQCGHQEPLLTLANDTWSMLTAMGCSSVLKCSIQKWGHELEISVVNIVHFGYLIRAHFPSSTNRTDNIV
jgi:hypothetical protein